MRIFVRVFLPFFPLLYSFGMSASCDPGVFFIFDAYAKDQFLQERFNLNIPKRSIILALGYMENNGNLVARQNDVLKKIGMDDDQIKILRDNRILEIDPIERLRLITRVPAGRNFIYPEGLVSRVNPDGILENVRIIKIEDGKLHVKFSPSVGSEVFYQTIDRRDAYEPIMEGQQIIVENGHGFPSIKKIVGSSGDNVFTVNGLLLDISEVSSVQLGLTPRKKVSGKEPDLSQPLSEKQAEWTPFQGV